MNKPSHTKVFSYIRFSSKKQADGDSLNRQETLAPIYAEKHGYTLVDAHYRDLGISGWSNVERGGLDNMLKAIDNGSIPSGSHIVIEAVDRLSRKEFDETYQLIMSIINRNVCLYVANEQLLITKENKNDLDNIIRLALLIDIANKESTQKSERVSASKKAKRDKARQGETTKHVCPFWLEWDEKNKCYRFSKRRYIADKIIELRMQGLGENAIGSWLQSNNYPVIRRGIWSSRTVARVYKDPAIYGSWQTKKKVEENGKYKWVNGEVFHDYYPALITRQQFEELNPPKPQRHSTASKHFNPFAHILKCGKCGASVITKRTHGHIYHYCSTAYRKLGCDNKGVKGLVERLFLMCRKLKHTVSKVDNSDALKQIDTIENQLARRVKSQSNPNISDSRYNQLEQEILALERDLQSLQELLKPKLEEDFEKLLSYKNNPQKFNQLARAYIDKVSFVSTGTRSEKTVKIEIHQKNGHVIKGGLHGLFVDSQSGEHLRDELRRTLATHPDPEIEMATEYDEG